MVADAMTIGEVTLKADHPAHPYLVRAYRYGALRAYAVLDAFGWAIVAPVEVKGGKWVMSTVDRYDPLHTKEPSADVRAAAIAGLARYAATGRLGA